jgi:protein TonB
MTNRVVIVSALIAQVACSTGSGSNASTPLHLQLPACSNTPLIEAPCRVDYDIAPEMTNTRDILQLMQRVYPTDLRDRRIGGTTSFWLLIDSRGMPARAIIRQSSGRVELDVAADNVVKAARFESAKVKGQAVPVWIELPVSFAVR